MIKDSIEKIINSLRHNTDSVLQEVQEAKVPSVYKMKAEVQQTYFFGGLEHIYNEGRLILLIKNLPIYFNLDRTEFIDTMNNMVDNGELNPFLIFLNGKFIRWSDIKLVHNFKDRYILIENFSLSNSYVPMDRTTKMIDIFNNWERFSHNPYGKFPANESELNQWKYDTSKEAVVCTINSTTYIGFVSDQKYDHYIHQLTVASTTSDDDIIGVIIAFHKDETGKEHTLSAIRCRNTGQSHTRIAGVYTKWAIVYNLNQSNQKLIMDGDSLVPNPGVGYWSTILNGCTLKIERTYNKITATTSQFNSNILDVSTKLEIDLESDSVLRLFLGAKQYGYSCLSQHASTYRDISFIDMRDNIILPEAEMVTLPFNVKYKENQTTLSSDNIFAFDESGFSVDKVTGPTTTVDLNDPHIYYETKSLVPGKVQSLGVNPDYKISKINPLLFRNGKLYTDAKVDFYGLNTFLVDSGGYEDNMKYKLFYYIFGNQSKDNILNVRNRTNTINRITTAPSVPDYIKSLAIPFDFKFDKNKSYNENIEDSLNYIIEYNPGLLHDVYKELNRIEVKNYTGYQILAKSNTTGYVTMPRSNKGRLCNHPIIFVNGKLFKNYHYTTYRGNSFTFPTMGITGSDIVEIMMFKDIDNRVLEGCLNSSNDDNYFLDSNIDIDNLRIFSDDIYDKKFDVPRSEYMKYEVDYEAFRIDNSKINIKLKDSYYYDRRLYIASSRQFRYFYTILKEATIDIKLPTEYAYCKNKNNYMIFINGSKIDNDDFQFTKIDKDLPFDNTTLYIKLPLKIKDKVEVFYVPEEMEEVITISTISTTGNIFVDRTKLPYSFDKDLYFIFVNGRKVNKDQIQNVNSHKVKILNNVGSVNNLTIIKHVNDNEAMNKLLITDNLYDRTVDSLNTADYNMMYSNGNIITNTNPNIKIGKIDNSTVTKQVINDYWLRTITTKVNSDELPYIISYEYDENIPYTEKDSDGNIIL